MTDVDVAAVPERVQMSGVVGELIRLPLTAPADQLLVDMLRGSQVVAEYCEVEADGARLLAREGAS